jgi:NADH-quinone oxidoreductase subunit L
MIENLFLTLVLASLVWMGVHAIFFFSRVKITEKFLTESTKFYSFTMVALSFALFCLAWIKSPGVTLIDLNDWIVVNDYRFKIRVIVDLLGATYALLSTSLIGIIFRFSKNYLHKEEGYFRFIFLLSTLMSGLLIVSFARSLDLLFVGWELVGTTSVLLISYFYTQVQPVRHSIKAIVSYRLCDMGILAASAWAHHHLHSTDFYFLPRLLVEHAPHTGGVALIFIGIFIIWASLAKAGQLPMSSWLPTAMEGPTPSSAIFYGALSVHLGPFLLLRMHDYLMYYPSLLWAIGIIGGVSAIYATFVGRTRSDAKTMLAYATISQVGLIYIEIALGFSNFALFHIVAHASLRTYQFLRSASIIQDFTENPVVHQEQTINRKLSFEKLLSSEARQWIFVHALHSFHLDYFTGKVIAGICFPFRTYMKMEDRWLEWDTSFIKKIIKKRTP